MILLLGEIEQEIQWRMEEITTLKMILIQSNFSREQEQVLRKHVIPAIYSLWEGFVVAAFKIYVKQINSLGLTVEKIHPKILTHSIDIEFLRKEIAKDFDKRTKFIQDLLAYLKREIIPLSTTVPTESNINYKVVNKILDRFNLQPLPKEPFEIQLDKLLLFRNSIAHGDYSIPIEQTHIDKFSELVIGLMNELFVRIDEGYCQETYRKAS